MANEDGRLALRIQQWKQEPQPNYGDGGASAVNRAAAKPIREQAGGENKRGIEGRADGKRSDRERARQAKRRRDVRQQKYREQRIHDVRTHAHAAREDQPAPVMPHDFAER